KITSTGAVVGSVSFILQSTVNVRGGWAHLTCTTSSLSDDELLISMETSSTVTVAVFVVPPQVAVTVFCPVVFHLVVNVAPVPVSAPVSPHEIMIKQGRNLPVEYWAHPF